MLFSPWKFSQYVRQIKSSFGFSIVDADRGMHWKSRNRGANPASER